MTYTCEQCKNIINSNKKIDNTKFKLLCKNCIKNGKVILCSAKECEKLNLDLGKLKSVYIKNGAINYYCKKDVTKLLNKIKKEQLIKQREEELINIFKLNKLEYNPIGDCYSYIHYGEPSIDKIIKSENEKLKIKNMRRIELANLLNIRNVIFDESILLCKSYVDNGGDLDKTAKKIELDNKLKHNKNYNNVKNKMGYNKALKIYGSNKFGTVKFY